MVTIFASGAKPTHRIMRRLSADKAKTGIRRIVLTANSSDVRVFAEGRVRSVGRRRVRFLPMPSAATVVSATAKQQHHNNNNEDQFHGMSPSMTMTSNRE